MNAEPASAPVATPRTRVAEVHLDEWVAPDVCDELGLLRPGKILEWMDVVGVLAATRHCRRPVVTASVDGLALRRSIRVGEKVTLTAAVAHTSPRSLGVSVTLTHGPARGDAEPSSVRGYMTFVACDDEGRALEVPQFVPETPAEAVRFREGVLRREFRQRLLSGQLPARSEPATPAAPWEKRLFVEELLKIIPRRLRLPWEGAEPAGARRRASYVHTIEPVRGSRLNFHGTLYGGTLMRWLESAASLSARAYADGAAMHLSALHGLTFVRPAPPHVFVHIRCNVAHVEGHHLTVFVGVEAEDPIDGTYDETLRAFLTYTAVEPRRLAPFECASEEEHALFREVEGRLQLQRTLERTDPEP